MYLYDLMVNWGFEALNSCGSQEQEDSWRTWTVLMQLCQMWSMHDSRSQDQHSLAAVTDRLPSARFLQEPTQTYDRFIHHFQTVSRSN